MLPNSKTTHPPLNDAGLVSDEKLRLRASKAAYRQQPLHSHAKPSIRKDACPSPQHVFVEVQLVGRGASLQSVIAQCRPTAGLSRHAETLKPRAMV